MTRVDNRELRKAVLEWIDDSGSWSELSRRLGWFKPNGQPDIMRSKRSLGLSHPKARAMSEYNALLIIDAIGRDAMEFDL